MFSASTRLRASDRGRARATHTRGAIWRRLVRQMAINNEAGMPLPETSATTTPS